MCIIIYSIQYILNYLNKIVSIKQLKYIILILIFLPARLIQNDYFFVHMLLHFPTSHDERGSVLLFLQLFLLLLHLWDDVRSQVYSSTAHLFTAPSMCCVLIAQSQSSSVTTFETLSLVSALVMALSLSALDYNSLCVPYDSMGNRI